MRSLQIVISVLAGLALGITASAFAWSGPSGTPPSNNVSAPVNVGSASQTKNGSLGVNGLAVFGNSLLQAGSYLNWGSVSGDAGYGIWDNSGTLEFKNSGGTWQSLQSIVYQYVGNQTSQPNWSNPELYQEEGFSNGVINLGTHKVCFLSGSGVASCGRCTVDANGNGTWSVDRASCSGNDYMWCEATCYD